MSQHKDKVLIETIWLFQFSSNIDHTNFCSRSGKWHVCVCIKLCSCLPSEGKSGISYFTMAVDISPTLLNYCGKLTKTFR